MSILKELLQINEAAAEKKWVMVDINIDYEDHNGRDKNKDFKIAVDCGTAEKAAAFHAKLSALDDLEFTGAGMDADDIVNGYTNSSSMGMSSAGPVAKPPKSAYTTDPTEFKIKGL